MKTIAIGCSLTAALCMSGIGWAAPPPTPKADTAGINSVIDSGDAYAVSHSGFWKFRSPKITKPFGNEDALELAEGKHVDSNGCKVLWIAAGGNMLCFSTLAHRETFLRSPDSYTQRAVAENRRSK